MRRAHLELVADTLLVEEVECRLHALAIRLRADEDPDERPSRLRHGDITAESHAGEIYVGRRVVCGQHAQQRSSRPARSR